MRGTRLRHVSNNASLFQHVSQRTSLSVRNCIYIFCTFYLVPTRNTFVPCNAVSIKGDVASRVVHCCTYDFYYNIISVYLRIHFSFIHMPFPLTKNKEIKDYTT